MNSPRITEIAFANMLLRTAREFVGLKEVKPNAQFDDPTTAWLDTQKDQRLRALMRPTPWQEGWAHCAAFGEAMVCESLRRCGATEEEIKRFARVHTAHVMTNFRAFDKLGILTQVPSMGALGFAQKTGTDSGHEFIISVPFVGKGRMQTIESNTSAGIAQSTAQDREGDWITEKVRNHMLNGTLRTRGFLSAAAILKLVEG